MQAIPETLENQENLQQDVDTGLSQTQQVPRRWDGAELGLGIRTKTDPRRPSKGTGQARHVGKVWPKGLFTRTGKENQVINPGPRRG